MWGGRPRSALLTQPPNSWSPSLDADLDTLVTALYVEIDDLIERPRGRGRRPLLSHAELLCLAVMQVLLRYPSERHWLRYANKHLRGACRGVCVTDERYVR